MRLDRLLANSGCGTRSSVKDAIVKGGVTVNGAVIRDPAFKAEETDDITYFGESIGAGSFLYFVFDKPDEVLCHACSFSLSRRMWFACCSARFGVESPSMKNTMSWRRL